MPKQPECQTIAGYMAAAGEILSPMPAEGAREHLTEIENHLRYLAEEFALEGKSVTEAETLAIAQFGPPENVAGPLVAKWRSKKTGKTWPTKADPGKYAYVLSIGIAGFIQPLSLLGMSTIMRICLSFLVGYFTGIMAGWAYSSYGGWRSLFRAIRQACYNMPYAIKHSPQRGSPIAWLIVLAIIITVSYIGILTPHSEVSLALAVMLAFNVGFSHGVYLTWQKFTDK